ncbi:MAG: isochorismate synthase MenF [Microcystaceae cyanobacterium]
MKEILQTLSVKDSCDCSAPSTREIRLILTECKAKAIEDQEEKIASLSQVLPPIDPLSIIQQFDLKKQLNFYWENREKGEVIAGIGSVQTCLVETNQPNRFSQAQQDITQWQKRLIYWGESDPFLPKNLFCGSFTFSEQSKISPTSPFPKATIFLPQLQIIRKHNRCQGIQNILIKPDTNIDKIVETYYHPIDWQRLIARVNTSLSFPQEPCFNPHHIEQDLERFRQSVISALEMINQKKFSKLVIAHLVDIFSTTPFPLIQALRNLRNHYPNCYVFALGNGEGSHFVGASPERLLSIDNQELISDAIAGSAPRGSTPEADQQRGQILLNSEKEQREHQAVVTFISQRLQALGLTVNIPATTLLKLSNIQHLWTPIYSYLSSSLHPLEIVAQLHPTPAVSGVPTAIACEEINRYEPFDRSLYAAPIGWIDDQGNSQFVVGIRSALITDHQARLYAGAGIVAGSEPDQEVAEIQLKLQAMLKTLP